jgi:hypothetical protein
MNVQAKAIENREHGFTSIQPLQTFPSLRDQLLKAQSRPVTQYMLNFCNTIRKIEVGRTANRISPIQTLHSVKQRDTIVDNNSIKFRVADRGATPAKPRRTACKIERPCVFIREVFASPSLSWEEVRLISVA